MLRDLVADWLEGAGYQVQKADELQPRGRGRARAAGPRR